MKPDLIIKPHGRGVPKVIWDHRSPTPVLPTLDWCGSSDGPISLRGPFAMWFSFYSSGIDSNRSYQCRDQPEVIGVIAFQMDSRPANLANSTILSRTSGPCSRGSIELVVFNTESGAHGHGMCTGPLSSSPNTLKWSKMTRLGMSRFISNISDFIPSHLMMELK